MILGTFLPTGKKYKFANIGECTKFSRLTERQIKKCIESGSRWRGWVFDEAMTND